MGIFDLFKGKKDNSKSNEDLQKEKSGKKVVKLRGHHLLNLYRHSRGEPVDYGFEQEDISGTKAILDSILKGKVDVEITDALDDICLKSCCGEVKNPLTYKGCSKHSSGKLPAYDRGVIESVGLEVGKIYTAKEIKNVLLTDKLASAHIYCNPYSLKKHGYDLDNVITSILAFGGLGLIFSFFSKPNVISAQNVQLAPPFPNYMVYIFAAMLIGGIGYFLVKKFKK